MANDTMKPAIPDNLGKPRREPWPIILSDDEMVALVRDDSETVWREVSPQPPDHYRSGDVAALTNGRAWAVGRIADKREAWPEGEGIVCPYANRGERLRANGKVPVVAVKVWMDQQRTGGPWFWAIELRRED